jgi:hypothetical protein
MLATVIFLIFFSILIFGLILRGPVVLIPAVVFVLMAAFFMNTEYGRFVFPAVAATAIFAVVLLLVDRILDGRFERWKASAGWRWLVK